MHTRAHARGARPELREHAPHRPAIDRVPPLEAKRHLRVHAARAPCVWASMHRVRMLGVAAPLEPRASLAFIRVHWRSLAMLITWRPRSSPERLASGGR